MDQVLYLADRDLKPVTDPVNWSEIDAVANYLFPGYAGISCSATSQVMNALYAPGVTAVLKHRGEVFLGGPVERPHGDYEWVAADGAGPGTVKFHFSDYFALIAARFTFPDPSLPFEDQDVDEKYEQTAPTGTILTDLVDLNAGPAAVASRQLPHLVVGGGAGLGSTQTVSTRFQPLGDELRNVATTDTSVGYRVLFDADGREATFEAYTIADRSDRIKFNRGLGNLRAVTFGTEIPKSTTALVAGQGEGTARAFVEVTDTDAEDAYWRMETFVNRSDTADPTVLAQAGQASLVEGAAGSRLATVTIDIPGQRFGEHYFLSDFVEYEPVPGLLLVDQVRAVHLQAKPRTGAVLTAMVGAQSLTRSPAWLRQSRDLARRLARLEAT